MGGNSSDSCLCCTGDRYAMERKFSSASIRQQTIIIEQLRESQERKKKSPIGSPNRNKVQKIVPINIAMTPFVAPRVLPGDEFRKGSQEKTEDRLKRELERAERNLKEENNLKSALTHPTIIKFLKSFMTAQSTEHMLDFYLDVAEIRGLERSRYYKGVHIPCFRLHFYVTLDINKIA